MKTQQDKNSKQSGSISTGDANRKLDKLQAEADKERSRKPGSQSNQSDRHNTGRGGGK